MYHSTDDIFMFLLQHGTVVTMEEYWSLYDVYKPSLECHHNNEQCQKVSSKKNIVTISHQQCTSMIHHALLFDNYVCMYVCVCVCVCMYVCMYVYMYMYACMYICMYVCMHVCMYVCFFLHRMKNHTFI